MKKQRGMRMKMRIAHHAEGRTFAPLIGMAGVCLFLGLVAATMLASLGRIFQSEDRFAKGLTIPADIEVASPLPEPARRAGYLEDGFQKALLDAWRAAPTADPCVVPSLPSLRVLASEHRALLMQYLAAHPAWRVFERRDVLCTARRWRIGSMWLWTLHGFYTPHDLGLWSGGSAATDFQSRTAIRLDSKPRAAPDASETRLKEGTSPRPVRLDKRWPLDSLVVVHCGSVAVELSEQSAGAERRLTKAALRELEAEFKTLLDRKEFTRDLLPVDAVRHGRPVLNLYEGMQPGIYEIEVWANPGEPGLVYCKAFEVTRHTRLSAGALREYSNERMGWSDDPNELFYSNATVTIYKGDWGQPYAARFEVWFVPDSGRPEKKLLERVFKIEGWQR
jgi:hypothetical protein